MAKVSVIIPTFNREHVLAGALKSVLEQSYQNFEVIVVDDYSEDFETTKKVVQSFDDPRFKYVYLDANRGPSGARNAALPFCNGDYISFLDSDDIFRPRKLEVHVEILENNPDVAMVYSDEYVMDSNGEISKVPARAQRTQPLPSGFISKDFFMDSFIGTMTVTLRRSIFEEMGGFDESLLYNEDDDLWFRIMLNYKVICSDYVSGIRRLHGTNMSRDRGKMTYYQFKCISKYIRSYPLFIKENLELVKKRAWSLLKSYILSGYVPLKLPEMRVIKAYFELRKQLEKI